MMNQSDNVMRQRGGVALRDYTQGQMQLPRGLKAINIDQVGHALAYASIGLGLMELIMPRRVQKMAGIRRGNYSWLIRLAGLRELSSAMLIWMQPRPNAGVWSRVIGDAMDLSLLGAAFTTPRVKKNALGIAAASIAGITAIDAIAAAGLARREDKEKSLSTLTQDDLDGQTAGGGFRVMRSITINRSPEELYQFWRNFENLPQFMDHLQSVEVIDDRRSHWVAKAPAGTHVEWDAEIIQDLPNQEIAWQSLPDSQVPNSGVVRFIPAPGNRGTVVRVEIAYYPPAGAVGRLVAMLFGEEPGQQVKGDLTRFKEVMETGEVIRSDAAPGGYGQKMQRPAQPLPDDQQRMDNKMIGGIKSLGSKMPWNRGKQAYRQEKEQASARDIEMIRNTVHE